jgi:hypothetical protein
MKNNKLRKNKESERKEGRKKKIPIMESVLYSFLKIILPSDEKHLIDKCQEHCIFSVYKQYPTLEYWKMNTVGILINPLCYMCTHLLGLRILLLYHSSLTFFMADVY